MPDIQLQQIQQLFHFPTPREKFTNRKFTKKKINYIFGSTLGPKASKFATVPP